MLNYPLTRSAHPLTKQFTGLFGSAESRKGGRCPTIVVKSSLACVVGEGWGEVFFLTIVVGYLSLGEDIRRTGEGLDYMAIVEFVTLNFAWLLAVNTLRVRISHIWLRGIVIIIVRVTVTTLVVPSSLCSQSAFQGLTLVTVV